MREGGEKTKSLMDRAKCTPRAEPQGLIFNIQKFSLHDGPGIRTTIFMKGCPLQCRWCSNPESQNATVDIMTAGRNCIDCKRCLDVCPKGCIYEGEGKGKKIDRRLCDLCGKCVTVCPSKSIEKVGTSMTVEEVVEEIQKDETFYHHSGGGVTVSGGSPCSSGSSFLLCSRHVRSATSTPFWIRAATQHGTSWGGCFITLIWFFMTSSRWMGNSTGKAPTS